MKQMRATKIGYILLALVLLGMAWWSYRNFYQVTYVYRFENQHRESDYRYVEYIPGDRVKVLADGQRERPLVTTKPLGRGTLLMIEGYGLGAEHPVQEMTLTYYVDLLGYKKGPPDMTEAIEWAEEYHASSLSGMSSYRRLYGRSAIIAMVPELTDSQISYSNMIRILLCVIYALFLLVLGFWTPKIQWTKSGRYGAEQLEQLQAGYDEGVWTEKRNLGERYYQKYTSGLSGSFFLYILLLVTASLVIMPLKGRFMLPLVITAIVCVFALQIFVTQRLYRRFMGVLTEECQPLAAIIAYSSIYGSKQCQKYRLRTMYPYQSTISIGYYLMGEFEIGLRHLDLVWQESSSRIKQSAYALHYHVQRRECLRMMGDGEGEQEEIQVIEELIKTKPRLASSPYAKNYQRAERIRELTAAGRCQEASQLAKEHAASHYPKYIQVAAHYDLWYIACLCKDEESMKNHEDFIYRYGKDLFYYARIKGEQQ